MNARLWLLVVLLLGARCVVGEITAPQPIPQQGMPVSVSVHRGGSMQILLRAYGQANQPLKFKLRVQPALGHLSEPRNVSMETAVVTYDHANAAEPAEDRFTFVVQSNAGVSAPAEVQIKIVDEPPILSVPDEVDFKNAAPGTTVAREITLANRGGGVVAGVLIAPENWTVRGDANYRLDRDQTAKFTLIFAPAAERNYRGELRYSSNSDRATTLLGIGVFPIAVQAQSIDLHAQRNGGRTGSVELENRTDAEQSIDVSGGARLRVPKQIVLPPRGKATLAIEAAPDDESAFQDEVRLSAVDFSATLLVRAAAAGPILRVNAGPVFFSKAKEGEPARAEVAVENAGGSRAFVQALVPEPFVIAEPDRAFALEPGTRRVVHLSVNPRGGESLRAGLIFQANDERAEVQLHVDGGAVALKPVPAQLPVRLNESNTTDTTVPEEVFSTVPPIRHWEIDSITPDLARIRWPAPAAEPLRYVIEQRQLSLDEKHELKIDWLTVKDLEIQQSGKMASATLRRLRPGTLYCLRIVSLNARGERSAPSILVQFFTPPSPPWHWRGLIFWLVAGLAALVVWKRFFPK